jgi:hypothetical protein
MRRLAALIAIGVGALLACALLCGPPAEIAGAYGANPPLPAGERDGVRGQSGAKPESTGSSPDSEDPADEADDDTPMIDPMSANAACYVCHMTFIHEEFSRVHLKEKITCIECHGVSAAHANDENIGATPPDVMFKRSEVDASCAECHEEHDVPARKIIARWLERRLSGRSPICTDCHGMHKIEQVEEEPEKKEEAGSGDAKSDAPPADE